MKHDNIYIHHALNHRDGEKLIVADGHCYRVDGHCAQTNTIYEYNGCFFHGCNICYTGDKCIKHSRTGQSMNQLLAQTKRKESDQKS